MLAAECWVERQKEGWGWIIISVQQLIQAVIAENKSFDGELSILQEAPDGLLVRREKVITI